MKWIPFILEDARVRLTPLALGDVERLQDIASQHNLVAYSPSTINSPEALRDYFQKALELQDRDECIPFAIYDKERKAYAGSTRFMHIDWPNKVLHIGSTWIGREFHGSGLNLHMKYLMLRHAFEELGFEKVEFRIDERNTQSRRAVEKLGGVLEGILRKNVYLMDGFKRNTCCYGILIEEWQGVKTSLERKLNPPDKG